MPAKITSDESIPWAKVAVGVAAVAAVGGIGYLAYNRLNSSKNRSKNSDNPRIAVVPPRKSESNTQNGPNNVTKRPLPKAEPTQKEAAHSLKNEGNELFKKGNFQAAIEMYTKAIDACPLTEKEELATYYQNRAAAFDKLNEPEKVVQDCSSAIDNNNKYAKAYLRRAKAAEKTGNYDAAVDDYTTACILEGFQQQKSTEDADKALKTLAEIKAKEMYQARGEHTLPLSNVFVESYLSSFCEDPILNSLDNIAQEEVKGGYMGALLALKQKRYSDVVKECTRELEQNAASSQWLPEATLLRATFALIQGNAALASSDFERFFALMNELSEEERNSRRKLKANAHVKRGSYHMQLGRKDESMEDFRLAEETDPENADVYHHRGQLLILLGEVDRAPADFAKCVELRPDFAIAKAQSCYALYRKAMADNSPADVTTAIVRFEQVVRDFPDCAEGYALLGQVYTERDNCADAKEMFEKALKLQPNNANILVHMGMLELQKSGDSPSDDDFNRAVDLMLRATKVDAHCEFAYETLGQLEVQRGKVRQATEYFDRALNLARTELELTHVFGLRLAARSQIAAAERLGISLPG